LRIYHNLVRLVNISYAIIARTSNSFAKNQFFLSYLRSE
jgi:hypothetical protein